MALLDRFRRRDDNTPQQPETPENVLLQALMNDERITKEQALSIPAVAGAVDFISSMIACMPVKLYSYNKAQDQTEERYDDPRVYMLNGDTKDTLDAYQMKKAMVTDYLMGKGGYCYIKRHRNDVTGLFYVKEENVYTSCNSNSIEKITKISVDNKVYDNFEFIKLLRNTKDGVKGKGLTEEVGKALEAAFNTILYQLGIVKTGGNKRGFLQAERKLGQEEINALKRAWANLYANNSENIVVLNEGIKFQEASNSSVDMQLDQNKKTLQEEINNIFHIEDDFYNTFKKAIYPIVKAFETALNHDLLLEKEKGKKYFKFDVKEILKANTKERYEAYKLAKDIGLLTINEMREEDMNKIEGLDVINVGLSAVLYDIKTQTYYTPNTDTQVSLEESQIDEVKIEDSEEVIENEN